MPLQYCSVKFPLLPPIPGPIISSRTAAAASDMPSPLIKYSQHSSSRLNSPKDFIISFFGSNISMIPCYPLQQAQVPHLVSRDLNMAWSCFCSLICCSPSKTRLFSTGSSPSLSVLPLPSYKSKFNCNILQQYSSPTNILEIWRKGFLHRSVAKACPALCSESS